MWEGIWGSNATEELIVKSLRKYLQSFISEWEKINYTVEKQEIIIKNVNFNSDDFMYSRERNNFNLY